MPSCFEETLIQKVQGLHSLGSSGYLALLKVKLSELSQRENGNIDWMFGDIKE